MLALGRAVGGQLATLLAGGGALSGVGGLRAAAALSGTRLFSAQPSPADPDRAAVSRVLLQRSRGGAAAAHAALTPVPWGLHWSLAPLTHALLLCTCWHASVVLLGCAASAALGLQCPGKRAAGTPVSLTAVPLPLRSLQTLSISIGCAGDVPRPRPGHGALHRAASTHQPGGAAGASAPGPTSGCRLLSVVVLSYGRPSAGAQAARGSRACLQCWSGLFRGALKPYLPRGGKLAASLRSLRCMRFVLHPSSLHSPTPPPLAGPQVWHRVHGPHVCGGARGGAGLERPRHQAAGHAADAPRSAGAPLCQMFVLCLFTPGAEHASAAPRGPCACVIGASSCASCSSAPALACGSCMPAHLPTGSAGSAAP